MFSTIKPLSLVFFLLVTMSVSAHGETWDDLLDEAKSLRKAGKLDSAIVVASQALREAKQARGDVDSSVALVLHRIGTFYHYARAPEAMDYYQQALKVWQTLPDPQPVNMAKTLNNLGALLAQQERRREAETCYKDVLEIKRKYLPENHPSTAMTLNNLGNLYLRMGDYVKAEDCLLAALEIRRVSLPPDDPIIISSLMNLGLLYFFEGRHPDAERLWLEALELSHMVGDLDESLALMGNLAVLYLTKKDHVKAESLCLEGLAMMDALALPTDHRRSQFLKNLGLVYRYTDRLEKAERCHLEDLKISRKIYDSTHPEYLRSLYNLANVYRELWRLEAADSLYQKILTARQQVLGKRHPNVAATVLSMATLNLGKGEYQRALSLAKHGFKIRAMNFSDAVMVLSESDALRYSRQMRRAGMDYLSCFLMLDRPGYPTRMEAADIYLSIKGPVSDEIFHRCQLVSSETDPLIQAKVARYAQVRADLVRSYINGPAGLDSVDYENQLDSLTHLAGHLERELARESVHFRPLTAVNQVDASELIAALPSKSCLIEFLKAGITSPDGEKHDTYLALVMNNKRLQGIMSLGLAEPIDSVATRYREHMARVAAQPHLPTNTNLWEYDSIAVALYHLVWKPLEPHISGYEMALIAPDGALNLVSFAGLKDQQGRYLVETTSIHYLTTGRDLLRLKRTGASSTGLLALGDPDYDATIAQRQTALNRPYATEEELYGMSLLATRGIRSSRGSISDITVPPLPGSRYEIDGVVKSWPVRTAGPVVILVGANASEDNFKREAVGKRAIHLATHGFYIRSERDKGFPDAEVRGNAPRYMGNPLLYSGLFLAGGNLHGQGANSANIEDGILTAEEVSTMNLRGTRLVVLSACESGVGDVQLGEGVYGLRRAFQMAGARTVVSALWPVSDKTTAEMMAQLYSQSKKSLPERIRKMQLAQIKKLHKGGLSDHPYNWAGFIALGDWR